MTNNSEFNLDKALSEMDPNGATIKGNISAAIDCNKARMNGPRRVVHVTLYKGDGTLTLNVWDEKNQPWRMKYKHFDTTIPSHWSSDNADEYMNLRIQGHPISEKVFDMYVKSGESKYNDLHPEDSNIEKFIRPIYGLFLENTKAGMSVNEALDSAFTLVSAKKRLRKEIEENQQNKLGILSGIKKTKEKGYKHINEVERSAEELKNVGFVVKRNSRNK